MTPAELRHELQELSLNQSDLAALTGRTKSAVSLWLSGRRSIPGELVLGCLRRERARQLRVNRRTMREAFALEERAVRLLKQARRKFDEAVETAKPTAATAGSVETVAPSLQREASS